MADNENNNEIIIPEGGHLINNYGPFPGPFGPGPGPEHHDGCNCPNLTIPQTTGLPKPDLVPDDFEKCLSYEEQICRLRQDFRNATAPDVDATGTIINNGGEPEVDVDAARTGAHSWLFNFIFKNAIGQQGPAGYSPEVTVTDITGGHRITITDEDHPSGQSVDVMDGVDGADGQPGAAATVAVGTTTTGAAGSSASVTNSGTSSAAVLNFTIPKGDKGDTGASGSDGVSPTVSVTDIAGGHRITITDKDHPTGQSVDVMDGVDGQDGAAATVSVGTTTTGEPGTNASVTNSGTSSAAVLNFTIPRGATGQNGVDGNDGVSPAVSISSITGGHEVTITDKDHPTGQSFNVMDGQNGSAGAAATVSVGTTTTGEAGTSASVTNSGTSSAAVLNFTIPRGAAGQNGTNGTNGTNGKDGNIWWTSTSAPTTPNYTFTIANLTGPTGATPKVGDLVLYSYYRYTITSVGSTTVLTGTRQSFRGATGAAGPAGPSEAKTYAATAAPSEYGPNTWSFNTTDVVVGAYGPAPDDNILYGGYLYKVYDPGNMEIICNARYQIASGGGGGGGATPIVFTVSQLSVGSQSVITNTSPQPVSLSDLMVAMKAGSPVYITQDNSPTTLQIAAMNYDYSVAAIGFAGWPMKPQVLNGHFVESGGVIQEVTLDYVNN